MAEMTRPLTDLELAVLRGLAAGLTAQQSARLQVMSTDGIRHVQRRIYRALRASNGAHAVAIAVKAGLI